MDGEGGGPLMKEEGEGEYEIDRQTERDQIDTYRLTQT